MSREGKKGSGWRSGEPLGREGGPAWQREPLGQRSGDVAHSAGVAGLQNGGVGWGQPRQEGK